VRARRRAARSRRGDRSVPLLAAIVAAAPLLYPAWITALSRLRPDPVAPEPPRWPDLSVILPAYREREVIAGKVDDVRGNGYPGELEIVVVAEDPETAAEARASGAQVIEPDERVGKSEAINLGVAATESPLVAITDADASLEPGSFAALARWFDDPAVGAVAGEKQVLGATQDLYWRYESLLKQAESRYGDTVAVVGELLAFRRSLFRPLPADVIVDDFWIALDIVSGGGSIRYEPEAVARESARSSLAQEWERRTRTTNGTLDTIQRRAPMLVPGRSRVAPQLWGHKLMRLLFGPLAHAILLAKALLAGPRRPWAAVFLAIHAVGIQAFVRQQRGDRPTAPERAIGQSLFLQATALGGLVRYLRGERPALWQKPERERPAVSPERGSLSPTDPSGADAHGVEEEGDVLR
jgi:cellulose synthase/poly-beta-1,6-N-acetylglucosamine synthase-like glycosyltransferase